MLPHDSSLERRASRKGAGAQRMDAGEIFRGRDARANLTASAAEKLALLEQENAELRAQLHERDQAITQMRDARTQSPDAASSTQSAQAVPSAHATRLGTSVSALREALENDLLLPYFQPQVSGEGAPRIIGAEALARWPQSDGRFISPSVFVPAAEAADLTYALDDAIFTAVCSRLAAWQQLQPSLRVAVNISEARFHDTDLVERVRDVLRNTGANPQCLLFEVTESVLITDFDTARKTLGSIRELGIAVALDDFGTGYSSLSYLRKLPLDAIKIDQSFVRELDGERDVAVVRAIIAMAQALRLQVIAEGVETAQQAAILSELGCPVLQGFLYSEAVSAANFEALLRRDAPMVARA